MKKEEFIALGIDEKLAEKAAEASKKELDGAYVPKTRFNEINEEKKQLEATTKEHEKQMETLKASAGDNAELTAKIETLQRENKEIEEKHKAELRELQLTNAIKLSIGDMAHDVELVSGLFDKSKLILNDDGKVTGLDEQMKAIKESKSFLFKETKPEPEIKPGFQIGAAPQQSQQGNPTNTHSMKDAITARLQSQMGQVKE